VTSSEFGAAQRIISALERIHARELAEQPTQFSDLVINGDFRRFLVARMGSTGSTWLAKLLDSHPDVSCTHEGVISQVYPRDQFSETDVRHFIRYFAWDTKHSAYRATGDVGSAWSSHLTYLPFTTALLLRHPARVLNTRLRLYPESLSYFPAIPESTKACMRELWDINIDDWDTEDRVFLFDAHTFASQIWAADKIDLLIRIEDMREEGRCHQIVTALTGEEYEPAIVDRAIRNPVNHLTGPVKPVEEIVSGFTPRQREWYKAIVADVAEAFGYDPLADALAPIAASAAA
jgi:hypothetical protein